MFSSLWSLFLNGHSTSLEQDDDMLQDTYLVQNNMLAPMSVLAFEFWKKYLFASCQFFLKKIKVSEK